MKENTFNKIKIISNLIYIISILILSILFLNIFYSTDIFNIKGFIISYILGIFLITIITLLFDIKNTITNRKKHFKELIFVIFTALYIVLFIKFINIPLKFFITSSGLINLIIYFGKIMLFAGPTIPLNIFLQNENYFSKKIIFLQTLNKILLFIILSLLFLNHLKLKGFVFTISLIELITFIFNILYIKIYNQKNKKTKS